MAKLEEMYEGYQIQVETLPDGSYWVVYTNLNEGEKYGTNYQASFTAEQFSSGQAVMDNTKKHIDTL